MEKEASSCVAEAVTARPVQLVLVRANGPLFYSLASAALLESGMRLAADRLLHFFGNDRNLSQWVTTDWLPRKMQRAAQLQSYVARMWPEYDCHAGLEQFQATEREGGTPLRPTAAHEALARCVATAQSGIFYRSLAQWAEDPRLRQLAWLISREEAEAFVHFRRLYDDRVRVQGFGCAAAWTTALGCVRSARDSHIPRAFDAVAAQCAANVPFPVLDYPEFVMRMGSVIERHAALGTPERVLFRSWKGRPRVRIESTLQRPNEWSSPGLRALA